MGRDESRFEISSQIGADEDADVVAFKALARVDASDLVDALRLEDPKVAVVREVPLPLESREIKVHGGGVLFADPIPAIASDETSFARLRVSGPNPPVEFHRAVEHLELGIHALEGRVGRGTNA